MNDNRREGPREWQPRFGLGTMLLTMLVFSVMAAAGSYFLRGVQDGRAAQLGFILFTLAAPLLLVVLVSAIQMLVAWVQRRR